MYNLKKTYANDNIGWAIMMILLGLLFWGVLIFQIFFLENDNVPLKEINILEEIFSNFTFYGTELLLGAGIILLGIFSLDGYIKRKKMYKWLSMHGTLVKNYPYYLETRGGRYPTTFVVIEYMLPDGSTRKIRRRWTEINSRERSQEGVDIIYDPSNPRNYHLQFNIEEIDDEVKDL